MRTGIILFALLLFSYAKSQTAGSKPSENSYIQFSGVVLDQDSLTPIPFVSILVKGTNRGVVSDFYGFFSMVINPGDELEFYSISHKRRNFKIADTLQNKYYYAIQVLTKDTIQLQTVDVYPWPTKDEFRRAFLALNLSDSDAERADKNLMREELSYLERTQGASASENYKYAMQAYYTKVYTAGQQPSFTLLNPVKWAEFIEAWRSGKLSGKSKTK
ncbi:MAG: carboxypeptidase-like regulatory domain-containing protein [Bacteroidia bacterium]|nr:carboxypeptidase-like regulatory domain-containing protein [Bacteroidia bacterium]